jgi:hypothetical protein
MQTNNINMRFQDQLSIDGYFIDNESPDISDRLKKEFVSCSNDIKKINSKNILAYNLYLINYDDSTFKENNRERYLYYLDCIVARIKTLAAERSEIPDELIQVLTRASVSTEVLNRVECDRAETYWKFFFNYNLLSKIDSSDDIKKVLYLSEMKKYVINNKNALYSILVNYILDEVKKSNKYSKLILTLYIKILNEASLAKNSGLDENLINQCFVILEENLFFLKVKIFLITMPFVILFFLYIKNNYDKEGSFIKYVLDCAGNWKLKNTLSV